MFTVVLPSPLSPHLQYWPLHAGVRCFVMLFYVTIYIMYTKTHVMPSVATFSLLVRVNAGFLIFQIYSILFELLHEL
jgi:hypothetical protein